MEALAIKIGLNIALAILQKLGVISAVEADGIKIGTHILQTVQNVQTYSNNDQLNPANSDFPAETKQGY